MSSKRLTTVLFDLDGTLLDLDMDVFLPYYLDLLARRFSDQVLPEVFQSSLLKATASMIRDSDGVRTNREIFMETFVGLVGGDPGEWEKSFNDFYLEDYPRLSRLVRPMPGMRRAVVTAFCGGFRVVIATNPLFPFEAIRQRLDWAEVLGFPYAAITTFEASRYCKPNPLYYEEIARCLGVSPAECLMVGNDVEEDLVAGGVGMTTFLLEEFLVNNRGLEPKYDYSGKAGDLERLLGNL